MKEIIKLSAGPIVSTASSPVSAPACSQPMNPGRFVGFLLWVGILGILFFKPFFRLARIAVNNDLYSYILLIPFISLYLIWLKRKRLAPMLSSSPRFASLALLVGLLAMAWSWTAALQPSTPNRYLPITIFAFLAFLLCGWFLFLGAPVAKSVWFPLAFLLLLIPLPLYVMDGIEVFLQYASAEAAYILFNLSGTPVFKEGLIFTLPGLAIEVAKECSGIRSTLVLFITSILAGQLFLRSPWLRAILTLAVVPIGIVRNAFRILTISLLTIHVDPQIIYGPIHRNAGPFFFILSLVAFFALLFVLRRAEAQTKSESKL